jgi:predicted TIM-barrel fold metal-dependent hydrolase
MIARRTLLKGASLAAMSAAVSGLSIRESAAQQVPYSAGTEKPKLKAPANACDCHMHIYDARFPVAANATPKPADALVPDYKLLQQRIGTTRNVVVTPSTYGTDNSVTLDAMAKIGQSVRGVAVVDTSVTDDELRRLDGLGVRGIRFNLVQAGATTVEMLDPLSKRVAPLGWHVQLNLKPELLVQIEDTLLRLPAPLVFDHLAHIPRDVGVEHASFRAMRKLIDKGQTWVKLSGAYQDTKVGAPTYADATPVVQAYVKAAPERWCGAATGRIRPRRTSRMMPSCSTCWRSGCRTRRRAIVSWCKTRRHSTASAARRNGVAVNRCTRTFRASSCAAVRRRCADWPVLRLTFHVTAP